MKHGDIITLKPKSKHGKDRVAQHGDQWRITGMAQFMGNPAVKVESLGETLKISDTLKVKDGRWVNIKNDPDFEIGG